MNNQDIQRYKAPLHKIIKMVCDEKDRKAKVEILQKHASTSLKMYLSFLFDPIHKFSFLPNGELRFGSMRSPSEFDTPECLFELHRHLEPEGSEPPFVWYLTDLGKGQMEVARVQALFERVVTASHPEDVKLLQAMKDKNPPTGLTRKVVEEAFPLLVSKWGPEPDVDNKPKRGRPPKAK